MEPWKLTDQRSSCEHKDFFCSRHTPAWWWMPGLKRLSWQTGQWSECRSQGTVFLKRRVQLILVQIVYWYKNRSILFHKLEKIVVSDLLWSHVFLPIHCRLKYYWIFKWGSNFWVYESYMKPHGFKIQMNQWYSSDLYSGIGWFLLLILSTKSYILMNSKQILLFSQALLYDYHIVLFVSLFNITGAPNENMVQNHLNIALLNIFYYLNGRYRHIFIP